MGLTPEQERYERKKREEHQRQIDSYWEDVWLPRDDWINKALEFQRLMYNTDPWRTLPKGELF